MKQEQFVERYAAGWQAFEAHLEVIRKGSRATPAERGATFPASEFPARYRQVCQQLALARARGYSPALVQRLQDAVQKAHNSLYRARRIAWRDAFAWLASGFPRLVRTHRHWMFCSAVLLFVPMIAMIIALDANPAIAYSVYEPSDIASYEEMYDPARHEAGGGRDAQSDLHMFGFYILNNISIGFRTFASGLLAGVGTVLVLLLNGVMIGTVAGHLTAIGSGVPFWTFVAGHSAPELLAIVIAGGAGLQLGFALLAPGRTTRAAALRRAGLEGALLALGAAIMLVVAAFIEAYWSSIAWLPPAVKYTAGVMLWMLVLAWLFIGGRERAA